jgi:hypothetical protein
MYGASGRVWVKKLEADRHIRFSWEGHDPSHPTTVEFLFIAYENDATYVRITETGFTGDARHSGQPCPGVHRRLHLPTQLIEGRTRARHHAAGNHGRAPAEPSNALTSMNTRAIPPMHPSRALAERQSHRGTAPSPAALRAPLTHAGSRRTRAIGRASPASALAFRRLLPRGRVRKSDRRGLGPLPRACSYRPSGRRRKSSAALRHSRPARQPGRASGQGARERLG